MVGLSVVAGSTPRVAFVVVGLGPIGEDGQGLGVRRHSQHVLFDERGKSGIARGARAEGLRSSVGVIVDTAQGDRRTEQRPMRARTTVGHSHTARVHEPTAIGEPVKRHVRVPSTRGLGDVRRRVQTEPGQDQPVRVEDALIPPTEAGP